MASFNLTAGVSLLAKTFSVLSCSSSLSRCTRVLPVSYLITSRGLTAQPGGPPKKPPNGFLRYLMQEKPTVVRHHPGMKVPEVIIKIAEQWKILPEEQKRDEAQHAMAQFNVEMQRYKAQLSPAEAEQQAADKREKRAKKETIRRKKEASSLGKPKRPRSSFNIFMSENFQEAQGANVQAKLSSLREDWKNMLGHKKQVYNQLAEDDKIRYMNEMMSWEEHMVEIGRSDLLREQSRPKEKAVSQKKVATAVAKKNPTLKPEGTTTTKKTTTNVVKEE